MTQEKPEKMIGTAVRLPADLLARLDAYVTQQRAAQTPGGRYDRADAVRQLLYRALEEIAAGRWAP